jgi:predicted nucleic acid-binding protein
MIVVSDTSPLNYLVLIGAIDVLPTLFGEVHVPTAVMNELQHQRTPELVKKWSLAPPSWVLVSPPTSKHSNVELLDPGEAEAIALATELGAAAILIDEKNGRRVAHSRGLKTLGTITVLELAAEKELLDLQATLATLRQTTFHISDELIESALQRDIVRRRRD